MPPLPSWMDTLLTKLTNGDIASFIYNLYSNYFGAQVFMSIILSVISFTIYIRGGLLATSGFLLLTGGVMAFLLPPEFHTLASILIVFGVASAIYSLIRGG